MRYLENGRSRRSIENIIEKMQRENTVVVVEGLHDVKALNDVVSELYAMGVLKSKSINVITLQRLRNNNLNLGKDNIVIVAMDKDINGVDKADYACSIVRERYPDARVDENTGRMLLGRLGVRCVEEIRGPVEEIMRG
ncbi:MAG: hypothetical protein ACP5RF_03855 [Candidatus Micrarchaeia archaeon]